MTARTALLVARLAELRRDFDGSFALPVAAAAETGIHLVTLGVGEERFALRLSDIGQVAVDVKITPCPSEVAAFRGLAGFRGALVPVYDLAALLGKPQPAAPRWTVLVAGASLALAFERFDGHVRLAPEGIAPHRGAAGHQHIRELARQDGNAWPVIDIASLIAAIRARSATFHREN